MPPALPQRVPAPAFAFLAVLLLYLASPGPGLSLLAWLALVPLLHFCRLSRPRQALLMGQAAFTLYYLLTIYWVVISMEQHGGMSRLASWPALLLLVSYMAIYPALFCLLVSRLSLGPRLIWLPAFYWLLLDTARGYLFSGFPWMDLAYSQYDQLLLIQCVDLGGHHLLSFVMVVANSLIYLALSQRQLLWQRPASGLSALLLVLALLPYGFFRLAQVKTQASLAEHAKTTIIQANIDQDVKWLASERENSINQHILLTNQARQQQASELLIWPETALPIFPSFDPLMPQVLARTVQHGGYNLFTGAPYVIPTASDYDIFNSAQLFSPDQRAASYFKRHLVPFGEYIPLRSILPLPGPLVHTSKDFSAGTSAAPLSHGKLHIGALICVEAIYPALARCSVQQGANLLANITNDAWFGRSSAPKQHLAMTIFRAVENRRSLARAANTGISAFILPSGEVEQKSKLFCKAYLNSELPLLKKQSIFTSFGYFFPFIISIVALIQLLLDRKKLTAKQAKVNK